MSFKEVRKKLAIALSVAMVLTMIPSSAFKAIADVVSDIDWTQTDLQASPAKVTVKKGETETFTVTVSRATWSNADVATGSDAVASANNAMSQDYKQVKIESSVGGIVETQVGSLDKGGVTVKVTGLKKGKTTLTVTYQGRTVDVEVEVTEDPKITDLTFEPASIEIDMAQNDGMGAVKVKAVIPEDATAEEKAELYKQFKDPEAWRFGYAVNEKSDIIAQFEDIDFKDADNGVVTITYSGVAEGEGTGKITYNGIEKAVKVTVKKAAAGPVVKLTGESRFYDEEAKSAVNNAKQKLLTGIADAERESVENQINAIQSALMASQPGPEISNDIASALKDVCRDDATTVTLKSETKIKGIDMELDNGTVIVKSMEADLTVKVVVDGKDDDTATETLLESKSIPMSVSVPALANRRNNRYVRWTHYDDDEMKIENSDVIEDRVTLIDDAAEKGVATVRSHSYSPFVMEFVAEDDDSVDDGPSFHGSSSTSRQPVVGAWVLAADGIRWWYRNPDGTWPANGWAQLAWNGKTDWYYFDAEGYMKTGWLVDPATGLSYYLHPISDGTQGHMYAGWNVIDGKWYYFSEVHDGTYGHLLVNTTTPDGYNVGADGVWIQ